MNCHWRSLEAEKRNEGNGAFRYHKSKRTRLRCRTCRTAIPFCLNASLNATLWPSGSVSTRTPSQSNSRASGLQSSKKELCCSVSLFLRCTHTRSSFLHHDIDGVMAKLSMPPEVLPLSRPDNKAQLSMRAQLSLGAWPKADSSAQAMRPCQYTHWGGTSAWQWMAALNRAADDRHCLMLEGGTGIVSGPLYRAISCSSL